MVDCQVFCRVERGRQRGGRALFCWNKIESANQRGIMGSRFLSRIESACQRGIMAHFCLVVYILGVAATSHGDSFFE